MPPSPSNPEGHYEDMPLVALHDDLLKTLGTDWQFSGEVDIAANIGLDVIKRYKVLRDQLHGEFWGMKDPRQCLLLPQWQQVMGERGRYLVVLRHWSASIQSLLKRSTRDMALGVGNTTLDGRFWQEPGHAARIWMAYNQKVLDFLEACPSAQRLVVTQQSLMQGLALPGLVNEQFGIPLATDMPSPINPSLVHDEVAESVRTHLSQADQDRMSVLWERLLAFADHRAEQESPRWVPDNYKLQDRWLAHSLLSASPFEGVPSAPAAKPRSASLNAEETDERSHKTLSTRAQKAYRLLQLTEAEHFTREAIAMRPDDSPGYVRLACILLVAGQAEVAEASLAKTIERLGEVPILIHYRATILDLLGRTDEAITLLGSASALSDILERHRIAYLLKSGQEEGRAAFKVWARHQVNELSAWQAVSRALAGTEHQAMREDLALRVTQIWNRYA
ncbi:hypothetical protein [Gilvimarinus xylanilyticus]|uniref:Tetratricopeptide repeat protein n=1 Tax=Gilvimarinus xylanilyticus TaxID=2944139 RepID=A0A9X2HYC0_9GAMM|nr:hypothetical protein [Gilvimarinus xylanilyticus]MCP8900280.1 hypothetical protein [Gilvimarinus xylanilyticus]